MAVILASQSPRRRELLERMGVKEFRIQPAKGEERADPALPPEQLVEQLSKNKAETEHGATPQQITAADIPLILDKPGKNLPVSANLSGNKAEGIAGSGRNSVDRGKIQFFPSQYVQYSCCISAANAAAFQNQSARHEESLLENRDMFSIRWFRKMGKKKI